MTTTKAGNAGRAVTANGTPGGSYNVIASTPGADSVNFGLLNFENQE